MGNVPLSKQCTKCKQIKLVTEFHRRAHSRDGYRTQCKECVCKAAKQIYKDPLSSPHERARQWRDANPGYKQCTKCKRVLPVSAFPRCSRVKSGLGPRCKVCRAEDTKKAYNPARERAYNEAHSEGRKAWRQRYYAKNAERIKANQRRYYAENAEQIKARVREYYREHAEERRLYAAERRKNNPDYERDYRREHVEEDRRRILQWRRDNRERSNDYTRLRRAMKRSNGGSFTIEEWRVLCESFGYRCACCGRDDEKLTIDHIVPVSKGGSNDISNIQPLCGLCNSRKATKTIKY